jgi:hypothetical protein
MCLQAINPPLHPTEELRVRTITLRYSFFVHSKLWLMPIILATQEAESWRIEVQSQSGQIVCETLSGKRPSQKRAGRVAQGEGPEFKPQ